MDSTENNHKKRWGYRRFIYSVIVLGYFLPIIIYCNYSRNWTFFTSGILISIIGSGVLIFFVRNWEEGMRRKVQSLVSRRVRELTEGGFVLPQSEDAKIYSKLKNLRGELEKQTQYYGQEVTYLKKELQVSHEGAEGLGEQLASREQDIAKLQSERQHLISQCKKFASRFQSIKDQYLAKADHQGGIVTDHENQISQQKGMIEQYQRELEQLKNRVKDLNYELKTVLELKEIEEDVESMGSDDYYEIPDVVAARKEEEPVWPPEEYVEEGGVGVQNELQRCINIAEEISGASRLGGESSGVITMFMDNYAIDMRRLFDQYRNIDDNVIFFYSPQEDRLVFINRQVRNLVGLTPERFINDFYRVVQNVDDWKTGLQQLQYNQVATVRLLVKDKAGNGLWVDCHLGRIPVGIFSNNVVGVLSSAA
jgi:hypothetical protein